MNYTSTNCWVTSDQHYGHKAIIGFGPRPFASIEQHDAQLIDNHNAVVKKTDNVFFVGDFSYKAKPERVAEILASLNGRKHMVWGNHDAKWRKRKALWESLLVSEADILNVKVHDPDIAGNTQNIVMCHYPFVSWLKGRHGSWNLHGHCHGSYLGRGLQIDVGVDPTASFLGRQPVGSVNGLHIHHVSKDGIPTLLAAQNFRPTSYLELKERMAALTVETSAGEPEEDRNDD